MTNLDSILKSRDITLPTKVHLVKTGFSLVMYGCESWTIKKAEHRRIDAFELWCWRRLLSVPWTARSSNQSILKEISPEYSLEDLMLKLKLQYFGYLMWRPDSLEKTLMLGKTEGGRRRGQQKMRWLDGWMASPTWWTWVWVSSKSWHAAVHGVTKSQTWLSDWTELRGGYWAASVDFPCSVGHSRDCCWTCPESSSIAVKERQKGTLSQILLGKAEIQMSGWPTPKSKDRQNWAWRWRAKTSELGRDVGNL